MGESRKLRLWVEVDGTWYGPDDDVPADVAEKITNPKVWTGARLARHVDVGGDVYGPDDHVPDHIAAQITNPGAWAGRKLPPAAARTAREHAGQARASVPPLLGSGPAAERAGVGGDAGPASEPDGDDGDDGDGAPTPTPGPASEPDGDDGADGADAAPTPTPAGANTKKATSRRSG